ncbi:Tryptophan synthase alpha chain [hydrothermal vent metagenome]|uniref:tryptophan synthase n=1 Tax=hydrothermal vent metagenome TaxID=652676 RepID=A0A3B1DU47_9ZZZZ
MNRIDQKFNDLQRQKKKAFVSFITAGDPNLKITEILVPALEKAGADIIELGVPFSDPLADGPTIQASYERALAQKTTLKKILTSVQNIRKQSEIPIVLMTSYNPIFHYGDKKFIQAAKKTGVDGLIIPDLPPEEAGDILKFAKTQNISVIFLIAPTTTPERIKRIVQSSSGFIYYVSLTGVTGARAQLLQSYKKQVSTIRKFTELPICVGFGISTAEQVKTITKTADGVIVGSTIVKEIHKNAGKSSLIKNVSKFILQLKN